jgi:hypothetical protein
MSFVGRLEDLALAEILQMLAVSGKTGKLVLTRRDGEGLLVFKNGKIIYAASNSAREAFGNILVCRHLVTEENLMDALKRQHRSREEKRLGTILVEMGAMSATQLEEVLRAQTEKVVHELLEWRGGFFKFDALDIPEHGEVAVDARDFIMEGGLTAEQLAYSASQRAVQKENGSVEFDFGSEASPPGEPAPTAPRPQIVDDGQAPTLATLKSLMAELRSPTFTGELTSRLLHFAATVVRRAAFFSLGRDGIRGMGHVGVEVDGHPGDDSVRSIRIPLDEPSVLADVVERRETFRGQLGYGKGDDLLIQRLGGEAPFEVVVVPMLVNNQVVGLLYGDNPVADGPIGSVDGLELLMLEAGLAMEKTALEIRLRSLQERTAKR